MKYRIEVWINGGAITYEKCGNNKKKLLTWGKNLCSQFHYQNLLITSSVTLYEGDELLEDWFLRGLNIRYKRLENE